MIWTIPMETMTLLCVLLASNMVSGTSTATIQSDYSSVLTEIGQSSTSEDLSETTFVFDRSSSTSSSPTSRLNSAPSHSSIRDTIAIVPSQTPTLSTSDKVQSSSPRTNTPTLVFRLSIFDASSDPTVDTSYTSTDTHAAMDTSSLSSFPSPTLISSTSIVTSESKPDTLESSFISPTTTPSSTSSLLSSVPMESSVLIERSRNTASLSSSSGSSVTPPMTTSPLLTTESTEILLHSSTIEDTLSTEFMSDFASTLQINSTSHISSIFETTTYESTANSHDVSFTQRRDQSTTGSTYLESIKSHSSSTRHIPMSSYIESSFTEMYTTSVEIELSQAYFHTTPILHVDSVQTDTDILQTTTREQLFSSQMSLTPSSSPNSSLHPSLIDNISTSRISLEATHHVPSVTDLTYTPESISTLISTTVASDRTHSISPNSTITTTIKLNTTSLPTTDTVTTPKPAIRLDTIEVSIAFQQNCNRVKTTPQLQMEFLESLVAVLETTLSDISDTNIHFEDLSCEPFTVEIHLTNVSREQVMAILDTSIANGSFVVPILEDGRLVEYSGQKATLLSHTDKGTQTETKAAIEDTEVVIIAIASFLFMVLMFFGSVLICRECYLRKRAASFNLLDVPHVDLKLTDFTLTRIPRPHMIYFAPGSKKSRNQNGHDNQFGMCKYGTDLTETERPSVNADQLHLRVHDHDDGLVIGVTCTEPSRSPTHESTSGSSSPRSESLDPSTQMLIKNGGPTRGRKGTTNPTYSCDEDQENTCDAVEENEQVIML